jgi:glycosyltransferase involved in cell wall biosynthesis
MLPKILRLMGFNIITMLHNFLGAINTKKMSINSSLINKKITKLADIFVMRSIVSSNILLTMDKRHYNILTSKYPNVNTIYIPQDLFPKMPFSIPNPNSNIILTIGYFGTYKKIEVLLKIYDELSQEINDLILLIAGRSNFHTPNYMHNLLKNGVFDRKNVKYLGFVHESEIPQLFKNANAVVVTNCTSGGSSGILSLCISNSRPLIAPTSAFNPGEIDESFGVELYDLDNPQDLKGKIVNVLLDKEKQYSMCMKNNLRSKCSGNLFLKLHHDIFRKIKHNKKANKVKRK